ncbi:hypothetical protein VO71_08420 [Aeromonas salmonicida subsp. smithia]|nr:hypothetical protein VO71_08420 [Aeromonas salmonicida subsp. smithia]
MIRTLIVDDELYAREELALHLGQDPDIEILGQAANAIEALPLIQRLKPDVVFLGRCFLNRCSLNGTN